MAASSGRSRWTSIRKLCTPKGLSATDVTAAIAAQNLILPAGTQKVGTPRVLRKAQREPVKVAQLNDLPVANAQR